MEEIFVGSVQAMVKGYQAYKDNIIDEPVFLAKKWHDRVKLQTRSMYLRILEQEL